MILDAKTRRALNDTPLRTILDTVRELPQEEPRKPKAKRRKTDRRTLRKRTRAYVSARKEQGYNYDTVLVQQFYKLRREMKRRARGDARKGSPSCWDWELTLPEWLNMWLSCPAVEVGFNVYRPAWLCRGRNSREDVQLRRADTTLPWSKDNILICKGSTVLYSVE